MKRKWFAFLLAMAAAAAFLPSCATGKSVVSESASIDGYHYAALANVMDYSGSAALLDLEAKIYDALASTRLTIIGERQIDELPDEQKERLLLVKLAATQTSDESVVTVNFTDYATGKPVASCRGAFGWGLSMEQDLQAAIKRVSGQINALF